MTRNWSFLALDKSEIVVVHAQAASICLLKLDLVGNIDASIEWLLLRLCVIVVLEKLTEVFSVINLEPRIASGKGRIIMNNLQKLRKTQNSL